MIHAALLCTVSFSRMDDLLSKSLDDIIRERGGKGGEKKTSGKDVGAKEKRQSRAKKAAPFKREGAAAPSGNSIYVGNLAYSGTHSFLQHYSPGLRAVCI
jgi:hypothetical protein